MARGHPVLARRSGIASPARNIRAVAGGCLLHGASLRASMDLEDGSHSKTESLFRLQLNFFF
jgi:hypothetical protein